MRFVFLFFPFGYLLLLASNLAQATRCSMPIALTAVGLGAAALMAIIVALSSSFADRKRENGSRFSVGTMMLIVTGLAIYLAYLGQLARSLQIVESNFAAIVSFVIFAIGFIVISSMVLVKFTAELVDVFLPLRQFFWRGKNIRSRK